MMGEVAGLPVPLFVLLLVMGILAVNVVVLGIILFILRRQIERIRQQWQAAGFTLIKGPEGANYRGHASVTVPMRGNGVVALTPTDLRVVRLMPRKEFVVPLAQITHVTVERAWHGSYRARRPVLVMHYQHDGEDAIGISLRNIEDWRHAIAQAAHVPVDRAL